MTKLPIIIHRNTVGFILIIFLLLFLISCTQDKMEKELTLNEQLEFNNLAYQNAIGKIFSDYNNKVLFTDSTFQFIDTLNYFYSRRSLEPIFIKSFEDTDKAYSILNIFHRAEEHGLDPEYYHFTNIINQLSNALNDTVENPKRHEQLAICEILLSDGILKYSYHLRYGYVDPKALLGDSYFIPTPDSTSRKLLEPLLNEDITEYIDNIQPKSEKYKKLQGALKRYNDYLNLDWPTITISSNKLEYGDNDSSLRSIVLRLVILELLDTTEYKPDQNIFYDSTLVNAIKKFQRLSGLNTDGIIGKGTLDRLNVTPEQYVNTIKINLERFRWNDYTDTAKYLLVNIPDFKVYAIENQKELFDIKVCTGLKRASNYQTRYEIFKKTKKLRDKPDDWETPCLYSQVSYMVLNPTWTVPASIIREEILREVKKDSNYLHIKNFKVFKEGVEIDLNEVDTKEFSSDKIPYTIVQDPGAGNALGQIKFMFNNPFGVYLHDTPTRAPFNNSNRAVSHGCVRVEKPFMLAEYLLRDHSKWNIDFLRLEIGQKVNDRSVRAEYEQKRSSLRKNSSFGKTTELILEKKIPLFIDYYTAWVDKEGFVNFRDDVYHKDKVLIDHMFPEK